MDQNDFWYTEATTAGKQANHGQQISGKDNDAAGFNDQSECPTSHLIRCLKDAGVVFPP